MFMVILTSIVSDEHDDVYNDGWLLDKFGCWGNFSDTNCRVPQREVSAGRQNINCIFDYLDLVFVFLFEELFRHKLSERSQRQSPKYPRKTLITSSAAPFLSKNWRNCANFQPQGPKTHLPPTLPIAPPPVFSAADNCELTRQPHKCLDSDTTVLSYDDVIQYHTKYAAAADTTL